MMTEATRVRLLLDVDRDEFAAVERAVDNAATRYGMAADALELMALASGGELVAENDFRLSQTLQLLSYGMRHIAETEGSELGAFSMKLYRARRATEHPFQAMEATS